MVIDFEFGVEIGGGERVGDGAQSASALLLLFLLQLLLESLHRVNDESHRRSLGKMIGRQLEIEQRNWETKGAKVILSTKYYVSSNKYYVLGTKYTK